MCTGSGEKLTSIKKNPPLSHAYTKAVSDTENTTFENPSL